MANLVARKERAIDVVNLVVAVCLFVSPWVLGFANSGMAAWNAWVSAVVMAVLALAALSAFAEWEEWLNALVGAWVVISPWVLSFTGITDAFRIHLVAGAVVLILALVDVWLNRRHPPIATAS